MLIYTKVSQIESLLNLPAKAFEDAKDVEKVYPFRCTKYFVELAKRVADPEPLIKQFFPDPLELSSDAQEDPFGEDGSTEHPYLVRRYANRLLVLSTNRCFMHCRFCMRKRNWKKPPFVFEDFAFLRDYLKAHPEIEDVLVSGGDPFTLPSEWLEDLLAIVRSVDTVRVLRIGTRAIGAAPHVVLEKVKVLSKFAPVWINAHFNHPAEITAEVKEVVRELLRAGCPVNSQTVLLKEVNDSYQVLRELFVKLLSVGVKPYYLFSCDPVKGVTHFYVPVDKGVAIVERLKREASGMAVPHFAVDGRDGKRILA